MSSKQSGRIVGGDHAEFPRRTMLRYSTAGGAALFAGLLGELVEAGQSSARPATPEPAGRIRRVVTGHTRDGKSYIASDELVDAASLWTTTSDHPIGPGPAGEARQVTRATGETRLFVASIQPHTDPKPTLANRIGFHRTPGVAYCYVLSGEIVFLVDQQEVRLKVGDLVVERHTMHSWRNEGTTPVKMLITVVNASA